MQEEGGAQKSDGSWSVEASPGTGPGACLVRVDCVWMQEEGGAQKSDGSWSVEASPGTGPEACPQGQGACQLRWERERKIVDSRHDGLYAHLLPVTTQTTHHRDKVYEKRF